VAASIADVARRSGVSVATVSRALRGLPNVSPATRDRVRVAADELHYVADPNAARLAGQRTWTIGLVLPMLSTWYHSRLFEGIERAGEELGYDVLPYVVGGRERLRAFLADQPFRKRVDVLVVADVRLDEAVLADLRATGVPVLVCGMHVEGASSLRLDDRAATAGATRHLLDLGHTDIAVIGGLTDDPFDFAVPLERIAGVRDALGAAGLALPDDHVQPGDHRPESGERAMQTLLALRPRPTGVIALSDEMAIGALHAVRQAGLRVPDDVSVVGFDDHDVARHVELTTVRQDVVGIGTRLVEMLVAELADPAAGPRHEIAPTELVVRGTTGAPAGAAPRKHTAAVAATDPV
jgi:DNA-binding LacI/PurR family transcriptional regulator